MKSHPKDMITVLGARVHNLKNIDVEIPKHTLTVITGLSGSGKSSLAFDTIFAEGQRRYLDTFSAYARGFIGAIERPDVDEITGLSPVISIEQKTTNKNPRSTVGTTTEIYDFLRLLYARVGEAYSFLSNEKMVKYSDEQILSLLLSQYKGKKIFILAPVVRNRKGHYKELFEQIQKRGFINVRVDGKMMEIIPNMKVDRYKNHNIEILIDKMIVSDTFSDRLASSIKTAMRQGGGIIMIQDLDSDEIRLYSKFLMDPVSGLSYKEPAPHNFSFNSPLGACPKCNGIGTIDELDIKKIIPDPTLSIAEGGIVPLGKRGHGIVFSQIEAICEKHGTTLKTPINDIPEVAMNEIMFGTPYLIKLKNKSATGIEYHQPFDGISNYLATITEESSNSGKWIGQFISKCLCPECNGTRLNKEALHYKIAEKNIAQLCEMSINELHSWMEEMPEHLSNKSKIIATEIRKEVLTRLKFLIDIGMGYISLGRASGSLSGGESQRIRLATQIGSQLVNVLYILDEPSIGLHQRDNRMLIESLKDLRNKGNSVIVVEHDKDIMLESDYIIDMGPKAGRKGGEIVFQGEIDDMLKTDTLTSKYLNDEISIPIPAKRREGNGKILTLEGAKGNNLKDITVSFPLGTFITVTGVSGSGKSSLINETLFPLINKKLYRSLKEPLEYQSISGLENIDKIICVDQSPIGRTPRSNPATYTGVFSDIRNLFVNLPESQIRGYKPGRFSFNIKGGRCETCKGCGYKSIEMNSLPDVMVLCEDCQGKRYNRETLEVRFKGKSIADVLDMTINYAIEFFEHIPQILNKIKTLQEIGLGYITLGQSSTTLSGGESQRLKLATELARPSTGKTLYLLDEPSTGLHFEDIRILLEGLNHLVEKGNTVIVIEHNLDIIKCADYIIDLGPEGGSKGGYLMAEGTPEEVAHASKSLTAPYIKEVLGIK